MEKKKVEMTSRMERWKSLIEKAEEEEGRCMTSRRRDGRV